MKHFDLTQRTIFGLLSRNLFGSDYEPEDGVDWEAVYRESRAQAVALQVFLDWDVLRGIPEELRDPIRNSLFRSMMKNNQIHAQHTYLHRFLTAHSIRYVTLKGAASARYYPDPQSRAMGDVDFYVDRADFDRCLELFRAEGFEAGDLEHICHVVLRKKPMHLEMHHTPAGVPDGVAGEIVRGYLEDLLDSAELMEGELATCYCPSAFHHGLVMLMHLQHHILAEGVGLRHLCDWAVFVRGFTGDEFPEIFREKLKKIGLWKLCRVLSVCATQYLGLPEQRWMIEELDDEALAGAMMEDILAGGNFGNKDHQRIYEGLFISNRGKDGVDDSRLRRGFQALNRITIIKYPVCRRLPVLLPVCWVLAFGGYLIRTFRRNRQGKNIHVLSAYHKSGTRIRLYENLGIYEAEK